METTETLQTTAVTTTTEIVTNVAEAIQEQVDKTAGFFTDIGEYFGRALPVIVVALVVFIIGMLIAKLITFLTEKAMKRSNIDKVARTFLVSVIRVILYIVVVIMVLSLLNVPTSSIVTIFGAAGLAVSLALQNCLSNLCGGFIILFSKPFLAGDIIEFDGTVGKVSSIEILYTKIVTFDNKSVFIPNGKVSDAKIINYTESDSRRIDMNFNISYKSDYNKAVEVINGIISANKKILKTPEPVVRMSAHKESSVMIDVLVWVKNDDYISTKYDVTEAVKFGFDENGIEIPYNQLVVHTR